MTDAKPTSNPSQIRSSAITPPPELVREWCEQLFGCPDKPELAAYELARLGAQYGADQELEACCEWLLGSAPWTVDPDERPEWTETLRKRRRPKPLSLAEQAMKALLHLLDGAAHSMDTTEPAEYIHRALERLQELEGER